MKCCMLRNVLEKPARWQPASNYFEISESTDWKGDLTRLVLKDSEYAGLMLVCMKADKAPDEIEKDSNEEDPYVAVISASPKVWVKPNGLNVLRNSIYLKKMIGIISKASFTSFVQMLII